MQTHLQVSVRARRWARLRSIPARHFPRVNGRSNKPANVRAPATPGWCSLLQILKHSKDWPAAPTETEVASRVHEAPQHSGHGSAFQQVGDEGRAAANRLVRLPALRRARSTLSRASSRTLCPGCMRSAPVLGGSIHTGAVISHSISREPVSNRRAIAVRAKSDTRTSYEDGRRIQSQFT